ncbi:hypothetical protein ACSQ67_006764 [Phaseolus vulgaris]
MEVTGNIQKALDESLKNSIEERLKISQEGDDGHNPYSGDTYQNQIKGFFYSTIFLRNEGSQNRVPKFCGDNVQYDIIFLSS